MYGAFRCEHFTVNLTILINPTQFQCFCQNCKAINHHNICTSFPKIVQSIIEFATSSAIPFSIQARQALIRHLEMFENRWELNLHNISADTCLPKLIGRPASEITRQAGHTEIIKKLISDNRKSLLQLGNNSHQGQDRNEKIIEPGRKPYKDVSIRSVAVIPKWHTNNGRKRKWRKLVPTWLFLWSPN